MGTSQDADADAHGDDTSWGLTNEGTCRHSQFYLLDQPDRICAEEDEDVAEVERRWASIGGGNLGVEGMLSGSAQDTFEWFYDPAILGINPDDALAGALVEHGGRRYRLCTMPRVYALGQRAPTSRQGTFARNGTTWWRPKPRQGSTTRSTQKHAGSGSAFGGDSSTS